MLFKDKNKLAEYAAIVGTTNFAAVKPTIETVEEQELVPWIGEELYDYINSQYTDAANEDALEAPEKDLLHKCRRVIGPFLCYYFAPKSDVQLDESGMRRNETGTVKTAFQEQRENFLEQNLKEGELAVESLLQFLEKNKANYQTWVESDSFKKYRKLFIKTGKEFQNLFPSASPFRNYAAMRPKMMEVEENIIRKALGNVLFDALKTKDATQEQGFSDGEKVLLEKIKLAIAHLTVEQSIPFLNIRLDGSGFTVASTSRTTNNQLSSRNAAPDNAVSLLQKSCERSGAIWIANTKNYLNDPENAGVFTGWPIAVTKTKCTDETDRNGAGAYGFL
jgi:hypothetical protein